MIGEFAQLLGVSHDVAGAVWLLSYFGAAGFSVYAVNRFIMRDNDRIA